MWKKWFSLKENNSVIETDYTPVDLAKLPRHIAIIMDGNGRWAKKRGMARVFGHRHGVETLRGIVKAASEIGITVLTVYAFSTENWKRPAEEVNLLMSLFSEYLDNEIDELDKNKVQLRFIGEINALAPALKEKMVRAMGLTGENTGLILNIAVNYGARAEITRSAQIIAQKVHDSKLNCGDISEKTIEEFLYTGGLPDVDLLIRPSGDLRISNFLLWQSAYAEMWFTNINWPDFQPKHLVEAIVDFQARERRFGALK